MEEKEFDKVTAFDTLFTTNHIQMYKVLLAYLPPSFQKTLAVYIKLSELYYTLAFFNRHPRASLCGSSFSPRQDFSYTDSEGFSRLFDDISPYLSPGEQNRFAQIKNMMQSMKNMQEMMEMMEMMKSLFPEGMGTFTGDGMPNMPDMNFDPSMLAQVMQMMNGVADSTTESATSPTADDEIISENIN